MLVQVALIVFALCAALSLAIDLGYARLTQTRMQTAADAAALEGIRNRNAVVDNEFASDCLRRAAANRIVRWAFDDDFDVAGGDPDYQFGAGPIVDLTGGSDLDARRTMSVPDARVYKPDPQFNQRNEVYGDMVSGAFDPATDSAPFEDFAYGRNDFNPNPAAPQPPPNLPVCPPADEPPPNPWPTAGRSNLTDNAFLVRLRRSNELQGFAAQTEPGVASSGPSLPLTFGQGAAISADPSSTYSPRRDGLTLRATAIAEVRPALQVGLPQTNPAMQGVTPFAVVDTFVPRLSLAGTAATVNPTNGFICSGTLTACNAANAIGRFVANPTAISTVGRSLPGAAPITCLAVNSFVGYGPVYSQMVSSGTNRIIGFIRIGLNRTAACPAATPTVPAPPFTVTVSRGASIVAASNATAHLSGGLPLAAGVQPGEVAELLDKNLENTERAGVVAYGPVLVPVLAR